MGARRGKQANSSTPRGRVFVAYAHDDHEWQEKLENQLGFLKHHHRIDIWSDRQLKPGRDWDPAIRAALATADLFVPLVSSAFAASAYCNLVELRAAMERRARGELTIIPVLLDHVDYEASPFAAPQMLPLAEDRRPKPVVAWANPNEALTQVAKFVRQALAERLAAPRPIEPEIAEPEVGGRSGFGYQSDDRNVFPECAELLLSATQGSDAGRICLNAELRCGSERLRHGRRSFHLQLSALRLRLEPEGCSFPPGAGLGDEPSTPSPDSPAQIRRKAQKVWEIRASAENGVLEGYLLGRDNLCDLEVEEHAAGRVTTMLSAYVEDLEVSVVEQRKRGPVPRSLDPARAKLLKIVLAKALRRMDDEIVFSECSLGPKR